MGQALPSGELGSPIRPEVAIVNPEVKSPEKDATGVAGQQIINRIEQVGDPGLVLKDVSKPDLLVKPKSENDVDGNQELEKSRSVVQIMERLAKDGEEDRRINSRKHLSKTFQETNSVASAFIDVVGEWSRADNIWCGINGVGDSMATREFFVELLSSTSLTPDQQFVYTKIRNEAQILIASRNAVKNLLIADEATEVNLYEGGMDLNTMISSGLDEDRTKRVMTPFTLSMIQAVASQIVAEKPLWQTTITSLEKTFNTFAEARVKDHLSASATGFNFNNFGERAKDNLDHFDVIPAKLKQLENAFQQGSQESYAPLLYSIVDRVTRPQGYMEGLFYYANTALLKQLEINNNILPEDKKRMIDPVLPA